jgi:hypothetical protein
MTEILVAILAFISGFFVAFVLLAGVVAKLTGKKDD